MKPEYDFSNAERGKFFQRDLEIRLPIYLDDDVQTYLSKQADRRGVLLSDMVNDLLKHEIRVIESFK